MQKKLVFFLVFLMVSSFVFVFLFDTANAAGVTIFVDGDNAVGPWDGSSGHPFRFIQDGIDAVMENGTVYVFAGIYRENIVISKTINVNRTGKGNVIIDGRGVEDVVNISADHVTIRGCTIKNGTCGIRIYNSSGSMITENTIRDAEYGMFLGSVFNNVIYNNNFLNNTHNAYDLGSNSWDAGYLHGGNYWDDYAGVDRDRDGFGDTSYRIGGAGSLDKHPLMKPFTVPPVADFSYSPLTPTDLQIVTFNDTSTDVDGSIVSWFWDFGDGNTSTLQNATHQYVDNGSYIVTLSVVDDDQAVNKVSRKISVLNVGPTAKFTFFSPFLPKINDTILFTDTSIDTDGTVVSWSWDFGDEATSNVRSPAHNYSAGGTYQVSLRVTDNDGVSDTATEYVTIFISTSPGEDLQKSPLFDYVIFTFLGIAIVVIILVIRKYA
ncbi:MAG: PKD domain-containing protein [Thermoplasmata archaeon]|nr:PKD domain-containing protein [Thermoplasmata archaeon]